MTLTRSQKVRTTLAINGDVLPAAGPAEWWGAAVIAHVLGSPVLVEFVVQHFECCP